MIQTKTIKYS